MNLRTLLFAPTNLRRKGSWCEPIACRQRLRASSGHADDGGGSVAAQRRCLSNQGRPINNLPESNGRLGQQLYCCPNGSGGTVAFSPGSQAPVWEPRDSGRLTDKRWFPSWSLGTRVRGQTGSTHVCLERRALSAVVSDTYFNSRARELGRCEGNGARRNAPIHRENAIFGLGNFSVGPRCLESGSAVQSAGYLSALGPRTGLDMSGCITDTQAHRLCPVGRWDGGSSLPVPPDAAGGLGLRDSRDSTQP